METTMLMKQRIENKKYVGHEILQFNPGYFLVKTFHQCVIKLEYFIKSFRAQERLPYVPENVFHKKLFHNLMIFHKCFFPIKFELTVKRTI